MQLEGGAQAGLAVFGPAQDQPLTLETAVEGLRGEGLVVAVDHDVEGGDGLAGKGGHPVRGEQTDDRALERLPVGSSGAQDGEGVELHVPLPADDEFAEILLEGDRFGARLVDAVAAAEVAEKPEGLFELLAARP